MKRVIAILLVIIMLMGTNETAWAMGEGEQESGVQEEVIGGEFTEENIKAENEEEVFQKEEGLLEENRADISEEYVIDLEDEIITDSEVEEKLENTEGSMEEQFTYNTIYIGESGIEITGYTGTESELEIPSTIDGKKVLSIGEKAFWKDTDLKAVIVPEGVVQMKTAAFSNCTSLESVILPMSLTSIGEAAFTNCSNLKNVEIPENVTSIGGWAFSSCSNLESINIPDGVTELKRQTFELCTGLKTVQMSNNIDYMEQGVFGRCSSLEYIDLPESLKDIGKWNFESCTSLKKISIPAQVTSISEDAFIGCTSLEEVNFAEGIEYIGEAAFSKCTSIQTLAFPNSIKSISEQAFAGCTGLTDVTFGENMEYYDVSSFDKLENLTFHLYKNSKIELITKGYGFPYDYIGTAENNQIILAELEYELNEENTYSVSKILNADEAVKAEIPVEYNGKEVTEINEGVFTDADALLYVEFPETLKKIGEKAFYGCYRLNNIVVPENVEYIGKKAFAYNSNLTMVSFQKEELNDLSVYAEKYYISAFLDTPFLMNSLEDYTYNMAYRHLFGERPKKDEAILNNYLDEVMEEIGGEDATDSQKARLAYDWVCKNVCYIFTGSWPYSNSYGALFNGCASCAGYAETYKLIMDRMGIECQTVLGTCNGIYGVVSHMWNIIKINGTWYHVDAADTNYGDYSTYMKTDVQMQNIGHQWDTEIYPHNYTIKVVEPTCTSQGYTEHICSTCSIYYKTDYVEALGHKEEVMEIPPTCTEDGYTLHECKICGNAYKDNSIKAAGHVVSEWTVVVEAACESRGKKEGICSVCGETIQETIEELGHDYSTTIHLPQNNSDGYVVYMCRRCFDFGFESYTNQFNIASIEASKKKTSYVEGEKLNLDDIKVVATCENGKKVYISGCATNYDEIDMNSVGEKELIVTYQQDGLVLNSTIIIYVEEKSFEPTPTHTPTSEPTPQPAVTKIPLCTVTPISIIYTVTYEANGGKNLSVDWEDVLAEAEIGSLPTVERSGYTFEGWYTEKTGGNKITETSVIKQNQTLYAHWSKVKKPAKVKNLALKNKKNKQMVISYKKVSGAEGYEISYSTKKQFTKSATKYVTNLAAKKTIKGLKKKKTYYVRVRAYKVDSADKRVYGAYSTVKKVKIKK